MLAVGEALVDDLPGGAKPGGAPLNVACHLSALGQRTLLVSRVGNDAEGEALARFLEARGVGLEGVQRDPSRPTGRVVVRLAGGQPTFDVLPLRAFDAIDADAAEALARTVRPSLVYFGTLAQRRMRSRAAIRRVLRASEAIRFLDVNLRAPWIDANVLTVSLRCADVVKLNAGELEVLAARAGLVEGEDEERSAAEALLARYGIGSGFVTRGAGGAFSVSRAADGFEAEEVAGSPLPPGPVDTVGAGDGFAAVAILGILRGWSTPVTLQRADAFARAVCGVSGAIPADLDFYEPFRAGWRLEAA